MAAARSSCRLDPGWLFLAAGLTLCVAGVLIPAQQSLAELRGQATRIEHMQTVGQDGIEAHQRFLKRLRQRDPAVIRRLAAAQLNLMPAGDTPVLAASSRQATVVEWIGRSVVPGSVTAAPPAQTWLTWLTGATRRLWVFGIGVLLVFVGLLVDGRPGMVADVDWSDNEPDDDEEVEEDDEDDEEDEDDDEEGEEEEEEEEDEEEVDDEDDDEDDEELDEDDTEEDDAVWEEDDDEDEAEEGEKDEEGV